MSDKTERQNSIYIIFLVICYTSFKGFLKKHKCYSDILLLTENNQLSVAYAN